MSDQRLTDSALELATSVRMGNGVDNDLVARFRSELESASLRWRNANGTIGTGTATVLIELYPSLVGSIALYGDGQAQIVSELAESLLGEVLDALAD